MSLIGTAVYSKTPFGIEAIWCHTNNGVVASGTGKGNKKKNLNTTQQFESDYEITYFDDNAVSLGTYQLTIRYEQNAYHLKWIEDMKVVYVGVGVELDNKLHFGYRDA
ncbi:hypothetical protein [Aquimarina megaterium]|uniref:hypothetical protein n=1 Tax=Aquimarina megaterium TaxID=1443666 RepID=UPI000941CA85|nr:hypothetical protein [Aquimarina megaterium]